MTCMTRWNPFRGIAHIDPTTDALVRGPWRPSRWNELAIAPEMHSGIPQADAASRHAEKGDASSHEPASSTAATPRAVPASVPEQ